MNPIPYGRQDIHPEDIKAVNRVLRSDYLTTGPEIKAFEEAFAAYVAAPYAVAVANGTAALHLSLMCMPVEPGQKVLCTSLTFVASANCVLYTEGEIEFVDINPTTGIMDLDLVEEKLAQGDKGSYAGLILVAYAGHPLDMEKLAYLKETYGCWVVVDGCHALGAETFAMPKPYRLGSGKIGETTCFSFHPVKHIATGEGGMICTSDRDMYEKLLALRSHGITRKNFENPSPGGWYYEMRDLGFNYRMSDIHAALGRSQLSRAANNLERRRYLADRYRNLLSELPIELPSHHPGHAWHLFVIHSQDRKGLYDHLCSHNIYAQVHYIPVHLQPYYQEMGWKKGDLPMTENFYDQCLSIPMYPSLNDEQQDDVVEKIMGFFA